MARTTDKRAAGRDAGPQTLDELKARVAHALPAAFEQAQTSAATHQKNWAALHKLHAQAADIHDTTPKKRDAAYGGTLVFEQWFIDMVERVVSVKKGAGGGVAERLIKFISGYVKFVNEKATEDGSADEEDTFAFRFVTHLMNHLLVGFVAKDKIVRYRCVQIVAESVAFLGAIDEKLYRSLRAGFLARTEDKEVPVRVQTVVALGKMQASDDPDDREEKIEDVLLDILQHDPSGDVRRTALLSAPLLPRTLPTLLTRIRDSDATVRRTLLSNILTKLKAANLTPEQLARVVSCGLRDRDENVKGAARALVAGWIPAARKDEPVKNEEIDALLDFVQLFDIASSAESLQSALECIFDVRRDILDKLEFAEEYWLEMTPEKAVLARVFVEYCTKNKDEARMERALPVVTALAFRVQDAVNGLEDDGEKSGEEEFVAGEMLRMAALLDYADEIGRRKMFALVRDMLSQESLPDALVAPCLDVLRVLSASERDLIRVVVEIVHEVRDPQDEAEADEVEAAMGLADDDDEGEDGEGPSEKAPKPPKEQKKLEDMEPEERERMVALDLRSLALCIGMLERVNGSFEENSTLEGILADLIIPSVKRKETILRERGLVSLGLCCLIAKRMALNSFQLFLGQIQTAPEPLKIRVLQIAFDIMMVHEAEFLGPRAVVGEGKMVDFLLHTLENTESDEVQSVLCVGLSKLMLSGMITDERVLKALVLAYLSPQTADNQSLRQCLAYFLPVYCFSSSKNQRRMAEIAVPMFTVMHQVRADLDDDGIMVSQAQVGELLLEWTNPENQIDIPGVKHDETVHLDLAVEIAQALYDEEMEIANKKILCQMMSKVFIPNEIDDDKLRTLVVLLSNIQLRRPIHDTTAKNALDRFEKSLRKKFADKLEGVSEEDYRKLEHLSKLFEFLDAMPEVEEDEPPAPKKRGASRANKSTTPKPNAKTPARKRRKSGDSDDDSDNDVGSRATASRTASPTPTPAREKHSRSAAPKKSLAVDPESDEDEEASDDDDDQDEEDDEEADDDDRSPGSSTSRPSSKSATAVAASDDEDDSDDDDDGQSARSALTDDEDGATPVAVSKNQKAPSAKRKERATARTPSNRASKKPRNRSPAQNPKTPKRKEALKRVRSEAAEAQSPPRKRLKEVTNGRSKRGASRAVQSDASSEDES
ncbi:hypothetical protein EXIGLDRAFT_833051 [Exidia glandulosa HHB12029]|uniref:Nuclear condensin complex subunit 3 C-terminal domain-containing protein n=1 Tax=Exidia glandulosa HHB12029 TaxID=1314781 RepID=A0A165L1B8_EXIGL|nr:hypothetical protein EXIGLDRAFT_833051 [Exidia glandulosa HHB12029]